MTELEKTVRKWLPKVTHDWLGDGRCWRYTMTDGRCPVCELNKELRDALEADAK